MPERSGVLAYRPQLITYPDSLTSNLGGLTELLEGPLAGLFHGIHILPPFPSSEDRGFAPLTYREIDPRFGTWEDIARIAEHHDVLFDLMINHLSRQSPEFRDFERTGRRSPYADLFITLDKIWPNGEPRPADLARIFRRRPTPPFSTITVAETGKQERVWTTFGTSAPSEQIDLDVRSAATRSLITDWLRFFASQRIRIVRLDAVGFVIKKAGTSCFMVDPEIYEFLDWVADVADSFGLLVLPEVHDTYATHERVTAHGLWTYDFVLPGLVLHALGSGEVKQLADHLSRSPKRQFTTLDCHDGIPVSPDLDGILEPADMLALVDRVKRRGGNVNPLLSDGKVMGVDVHQLNCTYYSALDCDDDQYLIARAIQLFAPGIPQIYYVGLLAGANDHAAIVRDGDGRAINRHNYSVLELGEALQHSVVRRLLELVRLRNTHPAFDGDFEVEARDRAIELRWRNGEATCSLHVDLASRRATIADGRQARLIAEPV